MASLSSSSCRDDSLCDVASQQHRKTNAIMVLNVSLFWLWPFNYCNGHIPSLPLTGLMVARPGDLPEMKWKLISFSVEFDFDFWMHNVGTSLMFPRRKPASGLVQSCVGFELISAALYSTKNSQSINGNAKNRNNNMEALIPKRAPSTSDVRPGNRQNTRVKDATSTERERDVICRRNELNCNPFTYISHAFELFRTQQQWTLSISSSYSIV